MAHLKKNGISNRVIGSIRSYDGCCKDNVTLTKNFAFKLSVLRLFYVSHIVQNFRLRGTNGFYVKAENERFTAHAADSCCCENFKYEKFTSSFGRLWKQIASKSVPHVQHDYISAFNQSNH